MNLLTDFSRLYAKNVEYIDFTNSYLEFCCSTLYCLYVSICCCSFDSSGYFTLFTNNTRHWMSSINCCCVRIKFIFLVLFICNFVFKSFPPQFIGTLLGVMWTTAGIIGFSTYGLVRLAADPNHAWRVRI